MLRVVLLTPACFQGVFFRRSSKREADILGVSGYIRNHDEGHVEGVAVGTNVQLDAFKKFLAEGPTHARVERVDVLKEEEGNAYGREGFSIKK
ncbi:acylphosphatase [Cantharellus anzutake]|uniref:acylphosphatase n=1 Tax=Cantharellus anzutake TaxID=1750568 RepID=UPI001902DED9|nr:acylphosphatase [Cantharellus anzutake]KAF8329802.1 acylphosphatase [Cantharellus anzutake]